MSTDRGNLISEVKDVMSNLMKRAMREVYEKRKKKGILVNDDLHTLKL